MFVMNFLRALADLGFYYSLAGVFSTVFGGKLVLAALLFQSVCFALSSLLRRSRIARMAVLLPALVLAFLPVPLADRIVSVPPALYLLYLAWTEDYRLSWKRQAELLSLFGKVLLVAVWVMVVGFWEAAVSAGIPAALITAAASILLTRSLRHDPGVYLQPKYQLVSFAGIALVALAALVLGSEQAVRAAGAALGAAYSGVIEPLVRSVGAYLMLFLRAVVELVRGNATTGEREGVDLDADNLEKELLALKDPDRTLELAIRGFVFLAVAVAAVLMVLLLFLFFRRLAQRKDLGETGLGPDPVRSVIPGQRPAAKRVRSGTYAAQIRKQYRAYLRLCQDEGLDREISDTSTDVGEKSRDIFRDEEALTELRDIYQRARYQGVADRRDLQQFKRLMSRLKKARVRS